MRRSFKSALACIVVLVLHIGCGRGTFRASPASGAISSGSGGTSSSNSSGSKPSSSQPTQTGAAAAAAPSTVPQLLASVEGPTQPDDAAVVIVPGTLSAVSQYPATISLELIGTDTHFASGATAASFGPGIFVGERTSDNASTNAGLVQVNSPTSATVRITLDKSAAPGLRPVIVTTGGHQSIATLEVPPRNDGPVARADIRSFVVVGAPTRLDASGSTLPQVSVPLLSSTLDTQPIASLKFHWSLVSAPPGSEASLSNADAVQPFLVPDKQGTYIVELNVSDGKTNSSTWAVLSTRNNSPVAHAGADQFVAAGDTVRLNASTSTDTDGDLLRYAWSLSSAPAGSNAVLSDSAAVAPTFTADVAGDYELELTVDDAHGNTSSDSVLVSTNKSSTIASPGPPVKAQLSHTIEFDGSGSVDSADNPIACAWELLVRPVASAAQLSNTASNSCSAKPSLTADERGLYVAQLTVSNDAGYQSTSTTSANTDPIPPTAIAESNTTVAPGETVELDGSKSADHNGDSLNYFWALISRPAASQAVLSQSASMLPTFVADAAGDYVAQLIVSDSAFASTPKTILISAKPPSLKMKPAALEFALQSRNATTASLPVELTNDGGGSLTISRITIGGTDASQFAYTAAALPITLTAGETTSVNVTFNPTSLEPRSASLSIVDSSGAVSNLALSAFIPSRPGRPSRVVGMQFAPTSIVFPTQLLNTTSGGSTLTISNQQDAAYSISNLQLVGTNASDFSFYPPTTSFTIPGQGSAPLMLTFTPTAAGMRSASLRITDGTGQHDVPISGTGKTLGILNLQPATVGKDLELLAIGSVTVAPKSDLSITISSSDPSKLLLSAFSTDSTGSNAGVSSIVATLPANKGVNGFGFPPFWIQSLASSGTAQITMTAPGYTSGTATITLTPSGFVLSSPLGVGTSFTTQPNAADTNLTVSSAQLDTSGNVVVTDQKLRGGLNPSVTVTSATPAIGTIGGSPVSFQGGGNTSATVTFHPVAVGSTQVSITQPAGFTAPASGGSLTATVNSPSISLFPSIVGYDLEVPGAGNLNTAAPAGGLSLTITSTDPTKVLLSTDPLIAGSASITVVVPAGSTALPAFYIQGLASSGTVSLTATATGYSNGSANVLLTPSGFVLNSPNGGGDFVTTTLSAATPLSVSVFQLNSPSLTLGDAGHIRGGISVPVTVTSGTPGTGSIFGGSVTFHPGDSSISGMTFQANPNCTTPCTSVLSVSHTPDFANPASGGQITATVNKPSISALIIQKTVGQNLQVTGSGSLDVPAPSDLQITISSDNSNVLLSASPTTMGTTSLVVTVPQGSGVNSIGFPSYYIQSLAASGTAQITLSASGFNSSTAVITLAPSGFVIEGLNGVGGNFGILAANGNVNLTVRADLLDPNTSLPRGLYESVRGGFSATINVSSSDASVATIGGTPLLVASGNDSGIVVLQPVGLGQTNVTMGTPSGFSKPANGDHLTVTIN